MSACSPGRDGNRVEAVEEALQKPSVAHQAQEALLCERHDLDGAFLLMQPIEQRDLLGNGQRRDVVEEQCSRALLRQLEDSRQLAAVERTHTKLLKLCEHGPGAAIDTVNQ